MRYYRNFILKISMHENLIFEKFLVSGGDDGSMRVWDLSRRKLLMQQRGHTQIVNDIVLFDDRHCLSCSRDRNLICWDLLVPKKSFIKTYVYNISNQRSFLLENLLQAT